MKPILPILGGLILATLSACGQPAPEASAAASEEAAIRTLLVDAYVEGIHIDRDSAAVRRGFHPDFVMAVYDEGELIVVPLQMWLDHLQLDGRRTSHTIDYAFSSIDVTGSAATAKMEIYEDGTHIYTDYFGLYEFPDGWKIVNKLFYDHD
ncbi:MAG: nuclear transport factor 2 family protein [Gemmatimonadota bacterium]